MLSRPYVRFEMVGAGYRPSPVLAEVWDASGVGGHRFAQRRPTLRECVAYR